MNIMNKVKVNNTILLKNIPLNYNENDLKNEFIQFGDIKKIYKKEHTVFAYITFKHTFCAFNAFNKLSEKYTIEYAHITKNG